MSVIVKCRRLPTVYQFLMTNLPTMKLLAECQFMICIMLLLSSLHAGVDHFQHKDTHLNMFIGVGVGKAFLIDLIITWIDFHKAVHPGYYPVVCAPTGTAAWHSGRTIRSLLRLSITQYIEYAALLSHVFQKLHTGFVGVHTIIIDEISMVSSSMVTLISRRLGEIKASSLSFGGLNVVVVGDLFNYAQSVEGMFSQMIRCETCSNHIFFIPMLHKKMMLYLVDCLIE